MSRVLNRKTATKELLNFVKIVTTSGRKWRAQLLAAQFVSNV